MLQLHPMPDFADSSLPSSANACILTYPYQRTMPAAHPHTHTSCTMHAAHPHLHTSCTSPAPAPYTHSRHSGPTAATSPHPIYTHATCLPRINTCLPRQPPTHPATHTSAAPAHPALPTYLALLCCGLACAHLPDQLPEEGAGGQGGVNEGGGWCNGGGGARVRASVV